MATITEILSTDAPADSREDINTNFSNLNTDKIEADGVTYENLNANSDVGTGATQVAAGNHAHSGVYEPVDATILREADLTGSGTATTPAKSDHTHSSVYEPVDATILRQAHVDDTPVDGVTTAPVSSNWAYDHAATVASDTVSSHVELATIAETNTGTDTGKAVTPDGLAGSNYGIQIVGILLNASTDLTTDDKAYFRIPSILNGFNLVGVAAHVGTASSSGNPTFTVKNGATSMLSTNLSIDATETDSKDATTAAVIDTAHDNVATGDWIEIATSTAGTGTKYAYVELQFQLP